MAVEGGTRLSELFGENGLFKGFIEEDFDQLSKLIFETRVLAAGDTLMEEGDKADEVYIIERGTVEILVKSEDTGEHHRVSKLAAGDCVGELALMDQGKRSAMVKATEETEISAIKITDLENTEQQRKSMGVMLKLNLASQMADRMRHTNQDSVKNLEDMLDQAEKRAEMGKFMSRVLIGTCLYIFALAFLKSYGNALGDTTFVTVPMLFVYAIGLGLNMKTSIYPMREYGFNLDNWQVAVKESLLFTIPILFIAVLVKWLLVNNLASMEGMPIFDFYQSKGVSLKITIIAFIAYTVFAPVQELISRSGIQSSLNIFLTGKNKKWSAIFLSTLIFSATHLHVSLILALLVIPLGIFWAWLYERNPTIIGPVISHVIIGCIGLFIIGFPTKGAA